MGLDINAELLISKHASDPSSSWSDKNDGSSMPGFTNRWDELSFPTHFGTKIKPAHVKKSNSFRSYSTHADATYDLDLSKDSSKVKCFDICLTEGERLSRHARKGTLR